MNRKQITSWGLGIGLAAVLLAGCSSTTSSDSNDPNQVKLTFFSANPDRNGGVGLVEQKIIDSYMKDHPNVKITVEALQDEPYKNKVKIYAANNEMPDILHVWGQPSFLAPLIKNQLLAELSPADYTNDQFVSGSLDGFSSGGKLYGLPKNADFLVMYYNKKLLTDNQIQPPKTQSQLLDTVKKLRANKVNPIAINGMDGWTLPIWYEYALQRTTGTFQTMDDAMARKKSFTDPEFIKATDWMTQMVNEKAFQDGFLTADYGAARNLFGQNKAAMYLMGSWEMGLATDTNFPDSFRQNVSVVPYPGADTDTDGGASDVAAWFGGGYSVSNTSKHKTEALDFLKYFYAPEHWPTEAWQAGAVIPAQKFTMTGKESELQKSIVGIMNGMKVSSGTPVLDTATPEFKDTAIKLHQKLMSKELTSADFAKQLDDAATKAAQASK